MPAGVDLSPSLNDWLDALERVTGKRPRQSQPGQYEALCPSHDDRSESLSVSRGSARPVVAICHKSCTFEAIRAALGFSPPPRDAPAARTTRIRTTDGDRVSRHEYVYTDSGGHPVFRVIRRDTPAGKKIHQERFEGKAGWVKGGPKGLRPLYGLPQILGEPKRKVVIVEGEKCVHAVRAAWPEELVTTWAGGTKAWKRADWTVLRDRPVSILADADARGRECAQGIASRLRNQGCAVKLGLPDGEDHADIADWLAVGGVAGASEKLAGLLRRFEPAPEPPPAPALKLVADFGWADTNPHYRVLGVEDDKIAIRLRVGVVIRRQRDRMTSPGTLIGLAPRGWWCAQAGEEKLSTATAQMLGDPVIRAADRRGMFELDSDPHLAGLPDGRIVDLRTGDTRQATEDGDRYVVGQLGAVPETGTPEVWLRTLEELFGPGHPDGPAFMQRWMGYCLTGFTHEQRFLVMHGPGGTGKSTLLSVMQRVSGSYFAGINQRGLFGAHGDHLEYLMRLKGRRLATVDDAPPSGWRAPEINGLVSGESETARGMGTGSEDFVSTSKLVFTCNSLPEMSPPNPGIERRIMPLELSTDLAIEPTRRVKLYAEIPRIVAWAIEGARHWYREGLAPTSIVEAAALTFARTADRVGAWLDECCEFAPTYLVRFSDLARSYHQWTDGARLTPQRFATYIANRRIEHVYADARHGEARKYKGLRVRIQAQGEI